MAPGGRILLGMAAAASVGLAATGSSAQLVGPGRDSFVAASIKSCSETGARELPRVAAEAMAAYCTCVANRQADMTTQADADYFTAHGQMSEDYGRRIVALTQPCRASAGLGR